MKSRAIIPLAVGLLVGILAIKIFADVLKKARGAGSANEAIQVICANSDITSTTEIASTMLDVRKIPKSLAPKGGFADVKELTGRVAALGIPKGMPITESFLAPKGTMPGMVVRIRDGFRAVAVKVDESASVGGWLKPGSRVDVVAMMGGDSGNRTTTSRVILENVEVLAVGQDIGSKGDVEASVTKSVTLAVLPADVPRLHLAATKGVLRLAMRNSLDVAKVPVGSTTDKELLGMSSTAEQQPASSSSGFNAGILGALFAKQPKMSPHKTDKDHKALSASRTSAVPVATPVQAQLWRVEVLTGERREEIWFDGASNGARRLDSKTEGRSRGLGSVLGQNLLPVPANAMISGVHPEPEDSSGPRESSE